MEAITKTAIADELGDMADELRRLAARPLRRCRVAPGATDKLDAFMREDEIRDSIDDALDALAELKNHDADA